MHTGSELDGDDADDEVTLSTGEIVRVPTVTEATMAAVVVPADRDAVADLLPTGLAPIRAGRGTAAVWLMSVTYHDIDGGAVAPYDEFVVALGATVGEPSGIPYVSPLLGTGGYVWYMPVTHEPARAFGDEVWGYPKVVADIDIDRSTADGRWETTVTVDGHHFLTLGVDRPPTVSRTDRLDGFTEKDGDLRRVELELAGEMGFWPYSTGFSCTLGDHPKARQLAGLDLGERAFTRLYVDGEIVTRPPSPLDDSGGA